MAGGGGTYPEAAIVEDGIFEGEKRKGLGSEGKRGGMGTEREERMEGIWNSQSGKLYRTTTGHFVTCTVVMLRTYCCKQPQHLRNGSRNGFH